MRPAEPPGPPGPDGVRTIAELADRLRALQAWSGLSYRDIHRQVSRSRQARGVPEIPALNTVFRCLKPGRRRLDADLVVDIAAVLLGDQARAAEWRRAHQHASGLAADAAVVTVVPELPADDVHFTGRRTELTAACADTGGVVLVEGMAGVGKTTFAVHAAHRLADRYRDLLVSVELRGHDPERPPADPEAVLDAILRLLGVPANQLQGLDLGRRSARYRELLAGRRALLLLDDAAGEDQVAPLLPGGERCLTLVTSRRRLSGIAGRRIALDVFTPGTAVDYLRGAVGPDRIDGDPEAAARIAELVGRLPLGVALAASRIRATRDWSLADHRERLAEQRSELRLEDGVELALISSYAALPRHAQRMLRSLALHPGRDCEPYAAAALFGTGLAEAAQSLSELVAANLVRAGSGRFALHDLVRVHARRRARDEDAPSARRAALLRLTDHYRYAVAVAMSVRSPAGAARRPSVDDPGLDTPAFADEAAANRWLEDEHLNLIAAALAAAEQGWSLHTNHLAGLLATYLRDTGRDRIAETLHGRAAEGVTGTDRARALEQLAMSRYNLGDHRGIADLLDEAVDLRIRAGDRAGEAYTLSILGVVRMLEGSNDEARRHFTRAVALAREAGLGDAEARALTNLGKLETALGNHAAAEEPLLAAMEVARGAGARLVEPAILAELGVVSEHTGRPDEAAEYYRQARRAAHELGLASTESYVLGLLGRAAARAGDRDEALARLDEALAIVRATGNRMAEATLHNDLGGCHQHLGEWRQAIASHQRALLLARRNGDVPEQKRARAELATCRAVSGH